MPAKSPVAVPPPAAKRLKPKRGTPGLYRVVARDAGPAFSSVGRPVFSGIERLAVDVGFRIYLPFDAAPGRPPRGLKAGAFVRVEGSEIRAEPDATAAGLFTYRAIVRRVIDGDTVAATIMLPHCEMDETLRLRGLDCPGLATPAGRAAKRYVEGLLGESVELTITTSKVDNCDRYLADVHVELRSGETIFLNNALLENGHAVPMGAGAVGEWVP